MPFGKSAKHGEVKIYERLAWSGKALVSTSGLDFNDGLDSGDFHTQRLGYFKEVLFGQCENCVFRLCELFCHSYRRFTDVNIFVGFS